MSTRTIPAFLISLAAATLPFVAQSAEIEGRIVGHDCASAGKVCPSDRLDPHLALERDFVLARSDGTWYFLPNVPRDIKIRHALESVTVVGEVDGKYNSIDVSEFNYSRDGKTRTAWSRKMEIEELQRQYDDYFTYR